MPTNMMYADSMFPRLRENEDPAESIKRTNNYLYMLLEQLRYSFHNLEMANFNAAALDRWEGIITDPIYVSLKGLDGKATELALTAEGLCLDIYGKDGSTGIKATVEGLYVDVNGEEGKFTKLSTTVNGLDLIINGGTDAEGTKYTALTATVNGISTQVYGKEGEATLYSTVQQSAEKINFAVADKNSEGKFTLTSEMASLVAGNIDLKGYVTFSRLGSVEYDEDETGNQIAKTIIDGGNIITGTLSASKITTGTLDASKVTVKNLDASKITTGTLHGKYLTAGTVTAAEIQGSTVYLLGSDGKTAAKFYLTSSDSSLSGVSNLDIESGAIAIYSTEGDVYIRSYNDFVTNYAALQLKAGYIQTTGDIRPGSDNADSLGSSSKRWTDIYAANGTIQTSDRAKKKDILYDLTGYDSFFDALSPCTFRFVDGHDRVHMGLISQDVEEVMAQCGIDSMELAAFIKSPNEDGSGYDYGLRYGEFISLLIDQVQKLKKRIKKLEEAA